jgi:hypothetical protein
MFQIWSVASIVSSDPFFEAIETRNISVNNRCIVNQRFVSRTGGKLETVGQLRRLDFPEVHDTARPRWESQIESVRYSAINAMLLNEFLKKHRTVQTQGPPCPSAKANRSAYCGPTESQGTG